MPRKLWIRRAVALCAIVVLLGVLVRLPTGGGSVGNSVAWMFIFALPRVVAGVGAAALAASVATWWAVMRRQCSE